MRIALFAMLVCFGLGCAAKKSAVKQPENTEKKGDKDKDHDVRDNAAPDDKDDHDPKRGGDPCEGGE